jgi:cystathionine beta-lyase/cystathionine gamma-synthase
MKAGGGMLSFEFKSGKRGADAFVEALEVISIATSLGGVESIIEIPKDLDFSEEELGTSASESRVPAGLIRLSVGIEDPGDLLRDVEEALKAAAKA